MTWINHLLRNKTIFSLKTLLMRYFLFVLTLFAKDSLGQQAKERQTKIDTIKLFDPKPDSTDFGFTEMFKNCVVLNQSSYGLVVQQKKYQINTEKELIAAIGNNKKEIVKSKLYVLVDSSISFNKIVSMIDVLKKSSIDNCKIENADEYFKQPAPIQVQEPTVTTQRTDVTGSNYFAIDLVEEGYSVTFQNKKNILKDSVELDKFVTRNQSAIDKNKILITSSSNTPYAKFRPVLEILKKHDYVKFQMITK
jgi:biopolymer transport protein ExbD